MKRRRFINFERILIIVICSAGLSGSFSADRSKAADPPLSGKSQWQYTMKAGVRFIPLFWISKSNVGGGKVTLSETMDGSKELVLLIGSDPDRAPRKINRWGYIAERISDSTTELTGIMSQSDEKSIDDADESTGKSSKRHIFKGIRSRQDGSDARSTTFRMAVSENYTYKDVDTLLERMPVSGETTEKLEVPAGVNSGFLFTVKEMLYEIAENYKKSGELSTPGPREYVYNAVIFNMSVSSLKMKKSMTVNDREYTKLIETKFEARNSKTGKKNRFEITCGTESPVSMVPVRIVYQPRWWFRAELLLDEGADIPSAVEEVGEE